MSEVTRILKAIEQGEPKAAEQLMPLVYEELRQLAAHNMAQEKPGQTLNATALVHEAYLRLIGNQQFSGRGHFFAAAAQAMRRILVENARRKHRIKHGGTRVRVEVDAADVGAPVAGERILELEAALIALAKRYPEHARLVQLRYFGGLTGDQAAEILGISPSTADRHWVFARAWLQREIGGANQG